MQNRQRKMSEIFKDMALSVMKDPESRPSSEAAHAALLLAHVAWNRAVGEAFADLECKRLLRKFEKSRRSLWIELHSRDWKSLVSALIEYKNKNYPDDMRVVVICGMREGNIHVEWMDPRKQSKRA